MRTEIFAHRGSKCNRPENTLESFKEAVRVGSNLELDLHLTKDQQLVVIHDETIDRTTNGSGRVRDFTVQELQTFDAGSWFSDDYKNTRIPSFDELLEQLIAWQFTGILNIEIKTDKYHYKNIEALISQKMTSRSWPFRYLYSSFNFKSLKAMKQLEPDTERCLLVARKFWQIPRARLSTTINAIHPYKSYLPILKNSKKPARFWTINDDKEMQAVLRAGDAGLITDSPERAIELRDAIQGK